MLIVLVLLAAALVASALSWGDHACPWWVVPLRVMFEAAV
jgi:hypothetical protein